MKYLPIVLACLLLACSHARTPEKPVQRADKLDCENVYTYIATLQTNVLDPDHSLERREREALQWEVEQEYEKSGAKDRFLRSCEATMTKPQVECALHVDDIATIHTCATLVH